MKRFSLYLLAALATVLCSCEHKELCYHHPHEARIRVVFDWRDAPEANPRGMCVLFYPETGGAPGTVVGLSITPGSTVRPKTAAEADTVTVTVKSAAPEEPGF